MMNLPSHNEMLWAIFAIMSRFHSYVLSAQTVLNNYKGEQPFPYHLKQFFAANKKYGSKDRKLVSECCYCWLRAAHAFAKIVSEENIVKSLFLCSDSSHPILQQIAPALNEQVGLPASSKLQLLGLKPASIFPFALYVGAIEAEAFALSFLQQPALFLRSRPGKEITVAAKLSAAEISFTREQDCFTLPNGTRLDDMLELNREAVVQDRSSQRVFDFLDDLQLPEKPLSVWDCCAASGGKSILLQDRLKQRIKLTVSDIRSSILHNCKMRLQQAGVNIQHAFVADVSLPLPVKLVEDPDIIICDAPCTGSGTWSRTPEQLAYFDAATIKAFSILQSSIAANAITHLKQGGLFIYITCSVFAEENEQLVAHLQQVAGLSLLYHTYISGYEQRADTMFVAFFRK